MTKIRVATRKHLNLISSDIETAWEGDLYKPKKGVPYQEVKLLSGHTDDVGFDNVKVGNHILQVALYYPSDEGTYDVEERAKEVVTHFKRGTKLINGDTCVLVRETPSIANLGTIDDRIIRVVTIILKTGE